MCYPKCPLLAVLVTAVAAGPALTQQVKGFQAEFLNDFADTSNHLVQLAQAMPADKYGWRPGAGVRSVSEVYVHIASGNYLLLALTGVKLPAEYYPNTETGTPAAGAIFQRNLQLEKTITDKDQVVRMLKASLDEVRDQFSSLTPPDLEKPADFFGQKTTIRRVYLRIFAHVNEHMGQSIAYARVNGVVPPWSRAQSGK